VVVPPGANQLTVQIATETPNAEVQLYLRFGEDIALNSGHVVADFYSNSSGGNQTITVTPSSSPKLRAGTYYIGFGVFTTGVPITGTVTAYVGSGSSGGSTASPALHTTFSLPAVSESTLFAGDYGFQVVVPPGASQLTVQIATETPNAEVQLYLRFGQDIALNSGHVVADFYSNSSGGNHTITVAPSSSPKLRAGTYYIGFGVFTTGVPITGTVTAYIQGQ
jgi:hypothetical protein